MIHYIFSLSLSLCYTVKHCSKHHTSYNVLSLTMDTILLVPFMKCLCCCIAYSSLVTLCKCLLNKWKHVGELRLVVCDDLWLYMPIKTHLSLDAVKHYDIKNNSHETNYLRYTMQNTFRPQEHLYIQPSFNKYINDTAAPFTLHFIYLKTLYIYLLYNKNVAIPKAGWYKF